jgi:hypothetical protein
MLWRRHIAIDLVETLGIAIRQRSLEHFSPDLVLTAASDPQDDQLRASPLMPYGDIVTSPLRRIAQLS